MTENSTPSSQVKHQQSAGHVPPHRTKRWVVWLVALVVVVAAAGASWWLLRPVQPQADRYQAVFLDNDQVFFGKLKNTTGQYLRLEQAYSTRQTPLATDATDEQKLAAQNNVSLVKVDELVYGPENTMMIRADKVKFWQDLKTDSKVSQAISNAAK